MGIMLRSLRPPYEGIKPMEIFIGVGGIGVFSAMRVLFEYERGVRLSPRQAAPGHRGGAAARDPHR